MKQKEANPLQGKLFMSAREIMATHDPNEPDRMYHGTGYSVSRASGGVFREVGLDPREGQATWRTSRTDDVKNEVNYGERQAADVRRGGEAKPYYRGFRPLRERAAPETDEQMYHRKLGESNASGLTKSIKEQGVKMPISLATETQGRSGRPNVAGGHHRLAVMANLNPDQLLPVMPVSHVIEAKGVERHIESSNAMAARQKKNGKSSGPGPVNGSFL